MPVNNQPETLLRQLRYVAGKEIRRLKKQAQLTATEIDSLNSLAATVIRVAKLEKELADDDLENADKATDEDLRKAAKKRPRQPKGEDKP